MEKTFREVIRDIKEGEVWECCEKFYIVKSIECTENGIIINGSDTNEYIVLKNSATFKLQRKQYKLPEVFAEYEAGAEIESVVTGNKYGKDHGGCDCIKYCDDGEFHKINRIRFDEIRGMWYINR